MKIFFIVFALNLLFSQNPPLDELETLLNDSRDCEDQALHCDKQFLRYTSIEKASNVEEEITSLLAQLVYSIKYSQKTLAHLAIKEYLQTNPKRFSPMSAVLESKVFTLLTLLKKHFPQDLLYTYLVMSLDPANRAQLYPSQQWSNKDIRDQFSSTYNGLKYPRFWVIYFSATNNTKLLHEYLKLLKSRWSILKDMHKHNWVNEI